MKQAGALPVCLSLALLSACSSDDNANPSAGSMRVNLVEDTVASGSLRGTDPDHQRLTYRVLDAPSHGDLEVDSNTGAFLYTPKADFFGTDLFWYSVSDGEADSVRALVTLNVAAVNDPPTLAEIPNLQNSAESAVVVVPLMAEDVDDTQLTYEVTLDDPAVATAQVDPSSRTILITAHDYGETNITVIVTDAIAGAMRRFLFSVRPQTKSRTVTVDVDEAIVLANFSDQTIDFRLTHNQFPMFQSDEDMAQYVHAMVPDFPDEPFQRKLWRFVRDNVYHSVPLSVEQWLYDPWVTVNSLGWGFCGHVAAAYVRVARAAGYEARVWGLTGHVVPEIRIGDRWEMYDPDTAVYFKNHQGQIAGVEELAADPTLITSPVNPIFSLDQYSYPYQSLFADFYGSQTDNFVGDNIFLPLEPAQVAPLSLPSRAVFVYPGHWVDSVEGVDVDVSYPVPHFLQGALTTEDGWTGVLILPWMLWDIQGQGTVELNGEQFSVGSIELAERIRQTKSQIQSVRVLSATSPLRFVLFMNALRYELAPENYIAVTSKDVWGIAIGTQELPSAQRAPSSAAAVHFKPRAPLP